MSSDQQYAIRTRDAMTRIIKRIIDTERPTDRYATVQEIGDTTARVVYVGEEALPDGALPESNWHVVKIGAIQPSFVGQRVRVGGPPDDRWIVDVIGQALINSAGSPATDLGVPTGLQADAVFRKILITWGSTGADLYEIQVSLNFAFTLSVVTYQTANTQFQTPNNFDYNTYFVRVRSAGAGGQVSEWSDYVWLVVEPEVVATSDGLPPSDSPDVSVIPALGFITAEWVKIPNNDTVTYEVYASLESGFIPSEDTKIGETTLTFMTVATLADGARLPYDNPTFVRVIATDADGAAGVGAQGFGTPNQVETGDAGDLQYPGDVTDGNPPPNSGSTLAIYPSTTFAYLKWQHASNNDAVTYEVHVASSTGYGSSFVPNASTLVLETPSNFAFVSKEGGNGPALTATQVGGYYARVYAKDADGYAPQSLPPFPGPAQAFSLRQITLGELDDGSVRSEISTPGIH